MVPRGPQKEFSRINFKQVLISSYESKMSARMLGWDLSPLWDAELAAHLIAVGGPADVDVLARVRSQFGRRPAR